MRCVAGRSALVSSSFCMQQHLTTYWLEYKEIVQEENCDSALSAHHKKKSKKF